MSDENEKKTNEESAETALAESSTDLATDVLGDGPHGVIHLAEGASGNSGTPAQLGYKRFVYAAYLGGALLVALLLSKIGHALWTRLGQWKPAVIGEPKDEIVFILSAVAGALIALRYWRKPEARQYADEVAEELSKVTWPNRDEVTNSTIVVVVTTLFATVFFAVMDRVWGYVTNLVYGS